jgi:serine/threonine protein kinase
MNEHRRRTYWANIYVGLQEGYIGPAHEIAELLEYCGGFCRKVGTTVSVTPTVFVYSKGSELGAIIADNPEGRMAAIKSLKSEHFGKQRETRFRDEIKFLTNEGNRPGILPMIDCYVPGVSSQKTGPWFATPLARCFTKLELRGVAKLPELVRHIEAVAQMLARLHAEDKWHRDLKPENLFLLDGIPVIGDFGLVHFPNKEPNTRDSGTLGSRNYTAPELETDAARTRAGPADVYSLSKTLWVLASVSPNRKSSNTIRERNERPKPYARPGSAEQQLQMRPVRDYAQTEGSSVGRANASACSIV